MAETGIKNFTNKLLSETLYQGRLITIALEKLGDTTKKKTNNV